MKSSVSLVGVGLKGSYQLVAIQPSIGEFTLMGSFIPTFGLYLMNVATGDLVQADDLPVTIRPGFIKQGKHNKFGNSDVTHRKVSGSIIPKEVSSVLGMSLPVVPDTYNTGFKVYNDPNLTKMRTYTAFSNSYSTFTGPKFHHLLPQVWSDGSSGTTGKLFIEKCENGWILTVEYDNLSYHRYWRSVVTGNLFHYKKGSTDKSPHLLEGNWTQYITTKSSGDVVTSGSTTVSGLKITCLTPQCSLDEISTELVLAGIGDMGDTAVVADLQTLSDLDRGNADWLSCYNAVESCKHINFETLEFLRDSVNVRQLLPPLKAFVRLASPKAWAQIFLWFHYGVVPMISSVKELTDALTRQGKNPFMDIAKQFAKRQTKYGTFYDDTQNLRGNKALYKCNARVTVHSIVQPENMVDAFFLVLKSFNLVGSATNIWELIPYSFVVDWFLNTNQFCKWVDYTAYPTKYLVDEIILSHKWTCDLPADTYFADATGIVTLSSYAREIHYSFPMEPFELRFKDPSSHWLEGIALLVSKT